MESEAVHLVPAVPGKVEAMNNSDERDYEEEAANLRLLHEEEIADHEKNGLKWPPDQAHIDTALYDHAKSIAWIAELIAGGPLERVAAVHAALVAYKDELIDNLATAYDNSENYGHEDDAFLGSQIAEVAAMLRDMEDVDELRNFLVKSPRTRYTTEKP